VDLLYVVRPGEDNEELRYSLRSVAENLQHDRVFVAGYTPSWVTGVRSIPVRQTSTKHRNAFACLLAGLTHPALSEDVVLMNDDNFVMRPQFPLPAMHRGPLDDVISYVHSLYPLSRYTRSMAATRDHLIAAGLPRTSLLSYELHVPLPVKRSAYLRTVRELPAEGRLQHRTIYGNTHAIGGRQLQDVKNVPAEQLEALPFLSTNDETWVSDPIGQFVRDAFPAPGPYEKSAP
jgi:hypothetical protein